MQRRLAGFVLLLISLAGCQPSAEERAVAEIVRLGGEVRRDGQTPGMPVITVILAKSKVTDHELPVVQSFPHLRSLDLRYTYVTDKGLTHLEPMTALQTLQLDYTSITDLGLAHLKALKELRKLTLSHTEVSDLGLGFVQELPKLEELTITNTKVSEDGAERMRSARSNMYIYH